MQSITTPTTVPTQPEGVVVRGNAGSRVRTTRRTTTAPQHAGIVVSTALTAGIITTNHSESLVVRGTEGTPARTIRRAAA